MTVRERYVEAARRMGITDKVIQKTKGFPSADAYIVIAALGAKLQRGHQIDDGDIREVARHYRNLPEATIRRFAQAINSYESPHDRTVALITAVAGEKAVEEGLRDVAEFESLATAGEINERGELNVPPEALLRERRTDAREKAEFAKHPHSQKNADNFDRHKLIESLYIDPREVKMRNAPAPARRNIIADQIERTGARDVRATDATLRDAIEKAYDTSTLHEMAEEELDAAEVAEVVEDEYYGGSDGEGIQENSGA